MFFLIKKLKKYSYGYGLLRDILRYNNLEVKVNNPNQNYRSNMKSLDTIGMKRTSKEYLLLNQGAQHPDYFLSKQSVSFSPSKLEEKSVPQSKADGLDNPKSSIVPVNKLYSLNWKFIIIF